jgi:hypothetical protein
MSYEEQRVSKFNAGLALVDRIDSLQRAINMARFNPLRLNMETGTYGYEIMVASNDSLINETWGKMSSKERKVAQRLRNTVHDFMRLYPPINVEKDGTNKINKENYQKLMELLNLYETKNKEFLDGHGMATPDYDDDDGL